MDATPKPAYPALGVAAKGIIRRGDGAVLLIRRSPRSRADPGAWDLPGGKMDYGERLADALAREVLEETGLTVLDARPFHVSHFVKEPFWVTCVTFECLGVADAAVRLSDEHVEHAWVPLDALDGRPYAMAIREQLDAFAALAAREDGEPPATRPAAGGSDDERTAGGRPARVGSGPDRGVRRAAARLQALRGGARGDPARRRGPDRSARYRPGPGQVDPELRGEVPAQARQPARPGAHVHGPVRGPAHRSHQVRGRCALPVRGRPLRDRLGEQRRREPAAQADGVRLPVRALHRHAPTRRRLRRADPRRDPRPQGRGAAAHGRGARLLRLRPRPYVQGGLPAAARLAAGARRRGRDPGGGRPGVRAGRGGHARLRIDIRRAPRRRGDPRRDRAPAHRPRAGPRRRRAGGPHRPAGPRARRLRARGRGAVALRRRRRDGEPGTRAAPPGPRRRALPAAPRPAGQRRLPARPGVPRASRRSRRTSTRSAPSPAP